MATTPVEDMTMAELKTEYRSAADELDILANLRADIYRDVARRKLLAKS